MQYNTDRIMFENQFPQNLGKEIIMKVSRCNTL